MQKKAERAETARGNRRHGKRLIAALAAVVAVGTSWALVKPAVTISRGCEKEEHTHTDACYEQVTVAKRTEQCCSAADEAVVLHQHDASCYDEAGELWCPLAERTEHTHSEDCYTVTNHLHNDSCYTAQRGALLCKNAEEDGHVHTDECVYDEETDTYSCGLTEANGHTHSDNCYEKQEICTCGHQEGETRVLSCTLPEISAHTHEEGCYGEDGNLVCEKQEIKWHTHTADCFEVIEEALDTESLTCQIDAEDHEHTARCYGTWRLACGKEEHTHGEECQPDYVCGIEEHTHTDACGYDEETDTYACGLEEHAHTDDCLPAEEPVYICGLSAHAHEDGCFDEEGELVCELEEHTHTDACLEKEYVCGKTEHTHVGTCFDEEGALICPLEEHTHTESCEKQPEEIVCGLEAHTHEDGCFDEEGTLVCEIFEHVHTAECVELSEAAREKVEAVIAAIDELQSVDELTLYFNELEGAGDDDALALAMLEAEEAFSNVCDQYYELTEGQRLCVTNVLKLEELSQLWTDAATLDTITDPGYYTQGINSDIHLYLFDYGSYINSRDSTDIDGDGKSVVSLHFFHNTPRYGAYTSLDGNYSDFRDTGGAWHEMCKTLQTQTKKDGTSAKYPKMKGNDYTLYYLFEESEDLRTGVGYTNEIKALIEKNGLSFADRYTTAKTYAHTNNYQNGINELPSESQGTQGNFRTGYASKGFSVNGDGGLFTKDENGYYTYDSAQESAYFDQNAKTFKVSDTLIAPGHVPSTNQNVEESKRYGNFLPFNEIKTGYDKITITNGKTVALTKYGDENCAEDVADLGFGMTMSIDFYMPAGGKVNNNDMVFEFEGDDDVWVYIDDVLVLDIGGTHGALPGTINFKDGTVFYKNSANGNSDTTTNLKSIFSAAGVSTDDFNGNTFKDWTKHTLKFYYIERGGNISYCYLKFNLQTLPQKSLTVRKELTASNDADSATVEHLKDTVSYQYRILRTDKTLLVKAGAKYKLYESDSDQTGKEMTVGTDGYFSLKPGQRAVFENMAQYFDDAAAGSSCNYVVEERIPTAVNGQYKDVYYKINEGDGTQKKTETNAAEGFTGHTSGECNALDTMVVTYTNCVDTSKLGRLQITKKTAGSVPASAEDELYTFCVELGGKPASKGMSYTVKADGKEDRTETVGEGGTITIKAGETAEIKVLAGTTYKVYEVVDKDAQYSPTYAIGEIAQETDYASGTVDTPGAEVKVTCTNTYNMGALEITKVVSNTQNPDATGGEFTFQLSTDKEAVRGKSFPVEVKDKDNKTVSGAPTKLTFEQKDGQYVAELKLQHEWTAAISDLPANTTFTVTETSHDGYTVSWKKTVSGDKDGEKTKESTGENAPEITIGLGETISLKCTNTRGVELPHTGGTGTFRFTAGGLLLMLAAAWLLKKYKFPRGARNAKR